MSTRRNGDVIGFFLTTLAVAASLGAGLGCGPLSSTKAASPATAVAAPGLGPDAPPVTHAQVASALASSSVDELVGLWAYDLVRGPATSGPIDVVLDGATARVTASGVQGSCMARLCRVATGDKPQDEHLLYLLPAAAKPGTLEGLWSFPDLYNGRGTYVAPVVLTADGTGHYRGEAKVLPMQLRAVLVIDKRPTGEVTAFFRERDRNLGRLLGAMSVKRSGKDVQLVGAGLTLPATLVVDAQAPGGLALELALPESDLAFHLTRRTRGDRLVAEFFPEPSPPYSVPPAKDDGWQVAAAAEVGASAAPLERFAADLAGLVPDAWSDLAVHDVVIAKKGKLIFERSFLGGSPDELHDIRSVGKSYATTLLGTAVDRRELSLDDSVLALLGEPGPPGDARWKRLKVRHLASMTSGLDCDDESDKSPGNEDVIQSGQEPNWYRATLALASQVEPGSRGVYCTMGINLLGALLEQRSSSQPGLPAWLPELFVTRLARPLQMSHYILNLMPTGQGYLGGGLRLLPRDMAKLGQLYLGKGTWNGQRILSPAWTAQAAARHASLSTPDDYGLGFWRTTFEYDRASYPAFYASGNGGQLIITIPALEAVIVFTAGNYNNRRTWGRLLDDYVPRYLIPALLGRP